VVPGEDFLSWADFDGWWPRFEDQVLGPLKRGQDARNPVRDWKGDEFGTSLGGGRLLRWSQVVVMSHPGPATAEPRTALAAAS
jgi:hypothetical protein